MHRSLHPGQYQQRTYGRINSEMHFALSTLGAVSNTRRLKYCPARLPLLLLSEMSV